MLAKTYDYTGSLVVRCNMCTLVVSTLDSRAVDRSSNLGLGKL